MVFCCCEKSTQSSHKIKFVESQNNERTNHNTIRYFYLLFRYINTGITMENTALNGTTNATKNQEWKTKKGYGPSLVAVSLALLLSLYAGGYLRSGTNLPPSLHRDEKGMTNAVASSSSTSLVGSGTAQGGSSAYCKKNTGYNCGAVFPPDGNTCGQKGCCCNTEDGKG